MKNGVGFLNLDFLNDTVCSCLDDILHLHGLKNDNLISLLYCVAFLYCYIQDNSRKWGSDFYSTCRSRGRRSGCRLWTSGWSGCLNRSCANVSDGSAYFFDFNFVLVSVDFDLIFFHGCMIYLVVC